MSETAPPPSSTAVVVAKPPRPKTNRKTDIVTKRNRIGARLWRTLRSLIIPGFLVGMGVWMYSDPAVLNAVLFILSWVFRIVFALVFAIMQFVAIFWFMSQTKMETIKPEDAKSVTFKEYWGQPALVNLVRQWISLLSDRAEFVKMGGNYINGILLYGPPGTGKTMLAKAMAGEAGIPFISVEGSGFRGMFWGVDVLRMIQYVGKAKRLARDYGACIAYIDEIDAVGMSRGGVMGGGGMGMMGGMMGGMASGALTRLLYEMDGIGDRGRTERWRDRWYRFIGKEPPKRHWHVLFMGSTNRPDVLDPALLRPGRFDQKIRVAAPDRTGRREIVRGYLRKIKHDETVNIEAIVEDTPQATPAQVASAITKDAVRIALFHGRARVSQRDIDQALQEQAMGIEQPIEEWDPEQRRQVAFHEAGHAVAQHYLQPEQRIVRVTIVPRGNSLGHMLSVDRTEVYSAPLRRFAAEIMVAMAGHVATKLFMGEYWTGAGGGFGTDFSHVRFSIFKLYTLGYFGPPVLGLENSTSGGIPPSAVPLIERFWKVLEDQTEQLLKQHMDAIEAIAEALLEKSDLSHDEVMALLEETDQRSAKVLPAPTLSLAAPAAVEAGAEKSETDEEPAEEPVTVVSTPAATVAPRMLRPPSPDDFARRKPPKDRGNGEAARPSPPAPAGPEAAQG